MSSESDELPFDLPDTEKDWTVLAQLVEVMEEQETKNPELAAKQRRLLRLLKSGTAVRPDDDE